jgi:hypothetical protein
MEALVINMASQVKPNAFISKKAIERENMPS